MTSTNAMTIQRISKVLAVLLPQCYPRLDQRDRSWEESDDLLRKMVARDRIELSTLRFSDFQPAETSVR
jgi:hypothetical protein